MKKFKWRRNSLGNVKAAVVAKTVQDLIKRRGGNISAADLLESARDPNSPIHNCFEWDNKKAAVAYRIEQAKYILRQIVQIEIDTDNEPYEIRAFVSVEIDDCSTYTTIGTAIKQPELRNQLLRQAYSEIMAFKKKYANLKEFAAVFDALKKVKIK